MKRALTGAVVVALSLLAQGCGASDRLVQLPDGRHIFMACEGKGSPTVLLESGYRSAARAWDKVMPMIARYARVCAYDRAGYGRSDPGPLPRDGAATARDLDAALRAAGIDGPFVMVGHSAGGLYVRLFSDLRPREVVGMVLVDSSVEHQDRRFDAVFGPGAGSLEPRRQGAEQCLAAAQAGRLPSNEPALAGCTPKMPIGAKTASWRAAMDAASKPALWTTAISELDTLWADTSDEIDKGRQSYGDMPLIVLTAEKSQGDPSTPQGAQALALWRTLHQEVAARSTRGQERLVAGSSHQMMSDRPDAIADAVREVLGEVRGAPSQP
jgi:pimeloyl-ACP methyl ester carboxylesterase